FAREGIFLAHEQRLPGKAAAVDEPGEAPRGVGAAAEAHDEDVGADVEDLAVRLRCRAWHSREGQELIDEPAVALKNVLVEAPARGAAGEARSGHGADPGVVELELALAPSVDVGEGRVEAGDVRLVLRGVPGAVEAEDETLDS